MTDLTKITTPFGLLDDETQAALKAHGGPWERYSKHGIWIDPICGPAWFLDSTYRVAPVALVPDAIDWSQLPKNWRFHARDKDGDVWVYERNPKPLCDRWVSGSGDFRRIDDLLTSYRRGTVDWRDSLVRRPE